MSVIFDFGDTTLAFSVQEWVTKYKCVDPNRHIQNLTESEY